MTPILIPDAIYVSKDNDLIMYKGLNKTTNPVQLLFFIMNKSYPNGKPFLTIPATTKGLNTLFHNTDIYNN